MTPTPLYGTCCYRVSVAYNVCARIIYKLWCARRVLPLYIAFAQTKVFITKIRVQRLSDEFKFVFELFAQYVCTFSMNIKIAQVRGKLGNVFILQHPAVSHITSDKQQQQQQMLRLVNFDSKLFTTFHYGMLSTRLSTIIHHIAFFYNTIS